MSDFREPWSAPASGFDADALIQEWGDLAEENAPDAALWAGAGTLFDAKRGALFARIAETCRMRDAKLSDKKLEMAAKADADYQHFLLDGERAAIRYHARMARMKKIELMLERARAADFRAGREAGLTR